MGLCSLPQLQHIWVPIWDTKYWLCGESQWRWCIHTPPSPLNIYLIFCYVHTGSVRLIFSTMFISIIVIIILSFLTNHFNVQFSSKTSGATQLAAFFDRSGQCKEKVLVNTCLYIFLNAHPARVLHLMDMVKVLPQPESYCVFFFYISDAGPNKSVQCGGSY